MIFVLLPQHYASKEDPAWADAAVNGALATAGSVHRIGVTGAWSLCIAASPSYGHGSDGTWGLWSLLGKGDQARCQHCDR